jgi:signal peptidase I
MILPFYGSFITYLFLASSTFMEENKTMTAQLTEKYQNCSVKTEGKIVKGDSLEPLIKNGQTVKVLLGYYNCHPIQRNDIVLYNYSGNKNPIIKTVKGVPGDRFSLEKTNNGWYISINGEILKNSQSQPYILDYRGYKVLSLYERSYKGTIPEDAYLILGNLPYGSLDSSHFGFVGRKDFLGKVELK